MYNVTMPAINFRATRGLNLKQELAQLMKVKHGLEQELEKAEAVLKQLREYIGSGYGSRADHIEEMRAIFYKESIMGELNKINQRINNIQNTMKTI